MRNHSRCLSFLLSGILSVSLLAPLSSAQAAYDGSIRNLVDRVTVLTESVQTESANEEELAKLDEMQAELEDKADAKEDVSETETVSMVVTGGTINVRTGPGTNYDKITQVVSGKQVTVVGESNGWYQVTFGSTTGWLLGEYLRDPADLDGTVGAKVVSMAMPFLGTRYRSGGASPNGFDCSGFTMYLYAKLGYSLPHSATAQYRNCGYAVAKQTCSPATSSSSPILPIHRTCGHLHREWSDHPRALQRRQDHDRQPVRELLCFPLRRREAHRVKVHKESGTA